MDDLKISSESPSFLLPEDKLSIDIINKDEANAFGYPTQGVSYSNYLSYVLQEKLKNFNNNNNNNNNSQNSVDNDNLIPSYLLNNGAISIINAYDELSRNYIEMSVDKDNQDRISMINSDKIINKDLDPEDSLDQELLNEYIPTSNFYLSSTDFNYSSFSASQAALTFSPSYLKTNLKTELLEQNDNLTNEETSDNNTHSHSSSSSSTTTTTTTTKSSSLNFQPQDLLISYSPPLPTWNSTFRIKQNIDTSIYSDKNLHNDRIFLLNFSDFKMNNNSSIDKFLFEPLFGHGFLCSLNDKDKNLVKLSENFYFDCSTENIKKNYIDIYKKISKKSNIKLNYQSSNISNFSSSFSAVSSTTSKNHYENSFHSYLFNLPCEDIKMNEFFIVLQISKIITNTQEKILSPYYNSSQTSYLNQEDINKIKKNSLRLFKYRQPVGYSIIPIRLNTSSSYTLPKINLTGNFYAMKSCYSSDIFYQIIKDAYSIDSTNSNKSEELNFQISLTLNQIQKNEKSYQEISDILNSPFPNLKRELKIISSQLDTGDLSIDLKSDNQKHELINNPSTRSNFNFVRKLMPLYNDFYYNNVSSRKIQHSNNNTLYLYLNEISGFSSGDRNLTVKIEVVYRTKLNNSSSSNISLPSTSTNISKPKLASTSSSRMSSSTDTNNYKEQSLKIIYDSTCLYSDTFTNEFYTRISYHKSNPINFEEIKIALPDIISQNYLIKFSVYHITVKNKKSSILSKKTSEESLTLEKKNLLGYTYFQLFDTKLKNDGSYTINFNKTNPNSNSFIKITTKTFSSFFSKDENIQNLFLLSPSYLGLLSSSCLPITISTQVALISNMKYFNNKNLYLIKKKKLNEILLKIFKSNKNELASHFLLIARVLIRTIQGGLCVCNHDEGINNEDENDERNKILNSNFIVTEEKVKLDELDYDFSSPYKFSSLRFHSFVSFLYLLNSLTQEDRQAQSIRDFLDYYVDLILDEEVPIPIHYYKKYVSYINNNSQKEFDSKGDEDKNDINSEDIDISMSEEDDDDDVDDDEDDDDEISSNRHSTSLTDASMNESNSSKRSSIRFEPDLSSAPNNDTNVSQENCEKSPYSKPWPRQSTSGALVFNNDSDIQGDIEEVVDEDFENFGDDEQLNLSDINFTRQSVRLNANRQSWGNYITDSMWLSGNFSKNYLGKDSKLSEFSEKYLDDIVNHIISQTERVVIESTINALVNSSINEVLSSCIEKSMSTSTSFSSITIQTRPCSTSTLSPFFNSPHLLSPSSSNFDFNIDDDEDLDIVLDFKDKKQDSHLTSKRLQRNFSFYNDRKSILSSTLSVLPSAPRYDNFQGYSTRLSITSQKINNRKSINDKSPLGLKKIPDTNSAEKHLFNESHIDLMSTHWWPWLYETLTTQYLFLLETISTDDSYVYKNLGLKTTDDQNSFLINNCKTILKMIRKSLSFRIIRESMQSPVLLDNEFFDNFKKLIEYITKLIYFYNSQLLVAKPLLVNLASFLRSLFALITPYQVLELVRVFFNVSHQYQNSNAENLKILMLEELSYFDHFVAINFPYTLDASLDFFSFEISNMINKIPIMSMNPYNSSGIRSSLTPTSYYLSHLFIYEVLLAFNSSLNQSNNKLKLQLQENSKKAWEALRILLVRHCYDTRYQSLEDQQRIICMYLPLFSEILKHSEYISNLKFDDPIRREMLIMFLYILGGIPKRILRSRIRVLTMISGLLYAKKLPKVKQNSTSRVFPVPKDKNFAENSQYLPIYANENDPMYNFISILHSCIDTFEFSFGNDLSNTKFSTMDKISGKRKELEERFIIRKELRGKLNPQVESPPPIQEEPKRSKSSDLVLNNNMNQIILDVLFVIFDEFPIALKGPIQNSYEITECPTYFDELIEICNVNDEKINSNESIELFSERLLKNLGFYLRENNFNASYFNGIYDYRLIRFLRLAFSLILHIINSYQLPSNLIKVFSLLNFIFKKYHINIIIISLEDSLQYWIKNLFLFLSHPVKIIRKLSCNFLFILFKKHFSSYGNIKLLINISYSVLDDIISSILDYNSYYSIKYLIDELHLMSNTTKNSLNSIQKRSKSSYFLSVLEFLNRFTYIIIIKLKILVFNFSYPSLELKLYFDIENRFKIKKSVPSIFLVEEMINNFLSIANMHDIYSLPTEYIKWIELSIQLMTNFAPPTLSKNELEKKNQNLYNIEISELYYLLFNSLVKINSVWGNFYSSRLNLEWKIIKGLQEQNFASIKGKSLKNQSNKNFFSNHFLMNLNSNKILIFKNQYYYFNLLKEYLIQSIKFNQNFYHLKDRSIQKLIHLSYQYCFFDINKEVSSVYSDVSTPSVLYTLGIFYRIKFIGLGFPTDYRNKEFIIRSSNRTFLSEYSKLLVNYLQKESLEVFIVSDITEVKDINDPKVGFIFISSLTPILNYEKIIHFRLFPTNNLIKNYVSNFKQKKSTSISNNVNTIHDFIDEDILEEINITNKQLIKDYSDDLTIYSLINLVSQDLDSVDWDSSSSYFTYDLEDLLSNEISDELLSKFISNYRKVSLPFIDSHNDKFSSKVSYDYNSIDIESYTKVDTFYYLIPFTINSKKSQAKNVDEQYAKLVIVTTPNPYPYYYSLQPIKESKQYILTPIKLSLREIQMSIDSYESELESSRSDFPQLMVIIQGTILPQVNGGVLEVVKKFLVPESLQEKYDAYEYVLTHLNKEIEIESLANNNEKLKLLNKKVNFIQEEYKLFKDDIKELRLSLINFLFFARLLLIKCKNFINKFAKIENKSTNLDYKSILSDFKVILNKLNPIHTELSLENFLLINDASSLVEVQTAAEIDPRITDYMKWLIQMEKSYNQLTQFIIQNISTDFDYFFYSMNDILSKFLE